MLVKCFGKIKYRKVKFYKNCAKKRRCISSYSAFLSIQTSGITISTSRPSSAEREIPSRMAWL